MHCCHAHLLVVGCLLAGISLLGSSLRARPQLLGEAEVLVRRCLTKGRSCDMPTEPLWSSACAGCLTHHFPNTALWYVLGAVEALVTEDTSRHGIDWCTSRLPHVL